MKVKVKKNHTNAVLPTYSKPGDAGMDLTAISVKYDEEYGYIEYDTGLQFEIPEGYVGLLFPRSSLSKIDLILCNHVGVLDSSYRGNVTFRFKPNFNFWSADLFNYGAFQEYLEDGLFFYYEDAKDEHNRQGTFTKIYKIGDRIGQLIILPYPQIEFEEVNELSETERGTGGYGSTNK